MRFDEKMISQIDDAIITKIFTYLTPHELLCAETCSRRWNDCTKYSMLWTDHLSKLWEPCVYNKPINVSLFDRVNLLTMSSLKNSLTKQVNCIYCIEKVDYQKTLISRLFLRGTNYPTGFPYKMTIPKWCLNMNDTKASYYFSLREIHRTCIFKSELCLFKWSFHFKQNAEQAWECQFQDDYTFYSSMHGTEMTWQFIEYDTFSGGNKVQVEQYPYLTFSRLESGAWRMENNYVFFQQLPSAPTDLPLI